MFKATAAFTLEELIPDVQMKGKKELDPQCLT